MFFSDKIRFSEARSATHGIRGPIDNLWLDYSQVTGTLNQMLVCKPGGSANARTHWELIYDDVGPDSCAQWRVSGGATKPKVHLNLSFVRLLSKSNMYCTHLISMQREAFSNFEKLTESKLNILCNYYS